jgi:membrane protease YdiL (CAAX protease family)
LQTRRMTRNAAEIVLVFAAFFLPGYFVPAGPVYGAGLAAYVVAAAGQTLLLAYIMSLRGPGALAASGVRPPALADVAAAAALAAVLLAASAALGWSLSLLRSPARDMLAPPLPPVTAGPAALALLAATVGCREELFYRCYLVGRLRDFGVPAAAAVGAAALAYAAGHLAQGPAAALLALVQGAGFGVLLVRGQGLAPLALAHALYDFVVLVGQPRG